MKARKRADSGGDPKPRDVTGKVHGSGGPPRSPDEVEELTDAAENLMLYGADRRLMQRGLGETVARRKAKAEKRDWTPGTPFDLMPIDTVDDYRRRVKDRWAANPLPDREEARHRQARRLEGQVRALAAQAGAQPARHKDIADRERLLAKITGAETPVVLEMSGPDGGPVPVLPPAAQAVTVHVYVPDNGKRNAPRKE